MGSVTYLLEVDGMERHVYKFEFKYARQVNGKKTEFTVPVIVHNECYVDACTKVDEYVRKNFADRVTEESTIKYVGEFVHGVLKPFVEVKEETDVKMFDNMKIKKSKVELVEVIERLKEEVKHERRDRCALVKDGYLLREEVQVLKEKIQKYKEDSMWNNDRIHKLNVEIVDNSNQIGSLQKRIEEYEAKERCKGGFTFIQDSRGSGKSKKYEDLLKAWSDSDDSNLIKRAIEAIEKQQPHIIDVNSLYPQAVDVCKVYQIERDQALKENEALLIKSNAYKKELSQLNLLMDDMEKRLEKEQLVRQGMNNQMKKWKEEMKRKKKIIDALTEVEK